jgi:hypothetical protein
MCPKTATVRYTVAYNMTGALEGHKTGSNSTVLQEKGSRQLSTYRTVLLQLMVLDHRNIIISCISNATSNLGLAPNMMCAGNNLTTALLIDQPRTYWRYLDIFLESNADHSPITAGPSLSRTLVGRTQRFTVPLARLVCLIEQSHPFTTRNKVYAF